MNNEIKEERKTMVEMYEEEIFKSKWENYVEITFVSFMLGLYFYSLL